MRYLNEYAEAIQSGKIIVGLEMKKEIFKLIDDLDNPMYKVDPTLAHKRMRFQEKCCLQSKAPYNNKPLQLMLWQKAYWEAVYGFRMEETGFRRFTESLLLIGRKNGKSSMMSADANTDLFIGEGGLDICCCSNDDKQADLIWREIGKMQAKLDPKGEVTHKNLSGIYNIPKDIEIFKMSSKTQNKDGRNISKMYYDEMHDSKDDEIYMAGKLSMSIKDEPLLLITTTEGFLNNMLLDKMLIYARSVLNDEVNDIHFLPWLYTQDSEEEIWSGDKRMWEKSNPSLIYGVKKYSSIESNLNKAKVDRTTRTHTLCKDFNIKQNMSEAWLTKDLYSYPAKFNVEDFKDCIGLAAVDLSETTDLTNAKVLLLNRKDPTKRYILSHYFIPETKLESNEADYKEWKRQGLLTVSRGNENDLTLVADWLYNLKTRYNIRIFKTGYDQRYATMFLKRLEHYGMDYEVVQQSKKSLHSATKLVEADFRSQVINFNENPMDMWCLGNAALEVDSAGFSQPVKISGLHEKRIDGAVTLVILYEMWRRYRDEIEKRNGIL
jgi:phage terminase large subunit-like protein